jgi:carboxyl-terminal processing protease
MALGVPPAWAVGSGLRPGAAIAELADAAQKFEREGKWARACEKYDEVLRLDRGRADIRRKFQECFRRLQQARRHHDPSFKFVAGLRYSQALNLYEIMLASLQAHYVERAKASPARMFQGGVEEFRSALKNCLFRDSVFRAEFLAAAADQDIRAFINRLTRTWLRPEVLRSIRSATEAAEQVRQIAMAAQKPARFGGLDLNASVVVLEFACGACTSLDEYTFYLTPRQFAKLTAAVKGSRFVGVGIELCQKEDKLAIARVLRGSPADREGLKADDLVLRIGHRPTDDLNPEEAMELLKGESGSTVELEVASEEGMARPVLLKREKLAPRSVEFGWIWQKVSMSMSEERTDIGYVQIFNFQKTTPQELDAALVAFKEGGGKALILDLRGNAGGSFEAAVECARRFLASGVIVTTKGPGARLGKHMARGNTPIPLTMPLVVLVDEDTASAAEVLAAALKDNQRAKLIGQRTFGKGCSQRLLSLTLARGGAVVGALRVTVAKFLSPNGEAFSGRGILPDRVVDRHAGPSGVDDNQLLEAKNLLQNLLRPAPMPMPIPMPMGKNPD